MLFKLPPDAIWQIFKATFFWAWFILKVFWPFWVVLIIFIIYFKLKLPFLRGWAGERFVKQQLAKLDQNEYKVLSNLLLPSKGVLKTTQIDHVVISKAGIFCIETKAHSGWIYGDADQEYWARYMFHVKEKFYNPLFQNHAHVLAIEDLIKPKYPQAKVFSLVIFTNAEKIKVSGTNSVGYCNKIIENIKSYVTPIFTDTERDDAYQILSRANVVDKQARGIHKQSIRDYKHSMGK